MAQGMQTVSRSWKRKGNGFFLEVPIWMQPLQHLHFRPVISSSDFWLPELQEKFVVICYSNNKKQTTNTIGYILYMSICKITCPSWLLSTLKARFIWPQSLCSSLCFTSSTLTKGWPCGTFFWMIATVSSFLFLFATLLLHSGLFAS